MQRIQLAGPTFLGVSAGKAATCQCPTGAYKYRAFDFKYNRGGAAATAAQFKTDIDLIEVLVNGSKVREVTGTHLLALNDWYGEPYETGHFPMYFDRADARTIANEDQYALATGNIADLVLRISLNAAAPTPELSLVMHFDPVAEQAGNIIRWERLFPPLPTAGKNDVTLPHSLGHLAAVHYEDANITDFELKVDGDDIVDGDITAMHLRGKRYGRTPQTNFVHFEPTIMSRMADVLPLADRSGQRRSITHRLTHSAGSATANAILETVASPFA